MEKLLEIKNPKLKTPSPYLSTKKENRIKVSPPLTIYFFFNKIQMGNP